MECTENRAMEAFFKDIPDVDVTKAWEMVVTADQERDLDDFRTVRRSHRGDSDCTCCADRPVLGSQGLCQSGFGRLCGFGAVPA